MSTEPALIIDPAVSIELELCWGTVAARSIPELLHAAEAGGFAAVTVTPHLAQEARHDGGIAREIARLVQATGVVISVVDPLIAVLPGTPGPDEVAPEYRKFFAYGSDEAFAVAEALGAPTINLAHFLGGPTDIGILVDAVGRVAEQAAARGLSLSLEFIPGSGIPDLPAALAILDAVGAPNAGLCLDNWHLSRSGGTVADVAALAPGRIRVLQISDRVEPRPGQGYVVMADRLLPGEGAQDLPGLIGACVNANPGLRVGVEVFSARLRAEPPATAARRVGDATRAVLSAS